MLLDGNLQFMIITVCVVQHHHVWAKRMLISSRSCVCVCVIHPSLPSLQRSTSKPLWWGWCLATINTQPFVCVCGPDCFQIHDLFLLGRWSRENTWPLISMKFSLFFTFNYLFEIRGNVINVFTLKYWIFFPPFLWHFMPTCLACVPGCQQISIPPLTLVSLWGEADFWRPKQICTNVKWNQL